MANPPAPPRSRLGKRQAAACRAADGVDERAVRARAAGQSRATGTAGLLGADTQVRSRLTGRAGCGLRARPACPGHAGATRATGRRRIGAAGTAGDRCDAVGGAALGSVEAAGPRAALAADAGRGEVGCIRRRGSGDRGRRGAADGRGAGVCAAAGATDRLRTFRILLRAARVRVVGGGQSACGVTGSARSRAVGGGATSPAGDVLDEVYVALTRGGSGVAQRLALTYACHAAGRVRVAPRRRRSRRPPRSRWALWCPFRLR